MATFSFKEWFAQHGKEPVTNVSLPVEGEEKPARMKLQGLCPATDEGLAGLARLQAKGIAISLPAKMTPLGRKLQQRATFEQEQVALLLEGRPQIEPSYAEKQAELEKQRELAALAAKEQLEKELAEKQAKEKAEAEEKAKQAEKEKQDNRLQNPAKAPAAPSGNGKKG